MTRTPTNPASNDFMPRICFDKQVTILNGQTVSSEIDTAGASVVGMSIPSTLIGTYLYFNFWDGDEWKQANVADPDNKIRMRLRIDTGVSCAYALVPSDFAAFQRIQIVSDTIQTSDVTIKLITRSLV